ncbi:hypothetical protein GLAREA_08018 [Glarea lozoyensis ATCC 20868]|uniref:Uncharacterized protein n=1 Tax=Glarea lozoyensis (strain ATCC 20868 / MF5171) TaxID=1116229 RepID=S3DBY2_GLAL2|nr:uncharacterized protein GLAREA_08018 [Glarea lozoyensis ATCC 20868]EPE24168.1 hypothetical protein GLAREA_08018 [Glarea lozoyensis ATCC 20868]
MYHGQMAAMRSRYCKEELGASCCLSQHVGEQGTLVNFTKDDVYVVVSAGGGGQDTTTQTPKQ